MIWRFLDRIFCWREAEENKQVRREIISVQKTLQKDMEQLRVMVGKRKDEHAAD